jgi:cobaltochelatase CobN
MPRWALMLVGLIAGLGFLSAADTPTEIPAMTSPARIGFVGVWDRAMPTLSAAAQASSIATSFFNRSPLPSVEELRRHDLVLVLNIDAAEASPLAERLREARAEGDKPRVLALDKRDSQNALQRAGVLEADVRIPAYWKANGAINLRRLFTYVGVTYLGRAGTAEPPILVPEQGFYLPGREEPLANVADLRVAAGWKDGAPVAAVLIQQSFWVTQDTQVIDALAASLTRHGFNVATVFAEQAAGMERLVREVKPDVLVEDRHGSMWSDTNGGFLAELNVPYLRPISMLGATIKEWEDNPQGLNARDRGMFMSLQELNGTIEPLVVGGLQVNIAGFRLHQPIPDRIERFAERAWSWVNLRRTANADKRVAIVYYNKYLGSGDLMRGSPTGAFLDGPESLVRFLPRLRDRGFTVERVPATAVELIGWLRERGRNYAPWAQGDLEKMADRSDMVLVPVAQYRTWYESKLDAAQRAAVEAKFGPPPGKLMVVRRNGIDHLVIPTIRLGKVILLPQPERGATQDDSLLHSRDVPPPHNYLAVHWWLQEEFKADALLMWGTHGSLELLPGKDAGLSSRDWSDICLGRMPVVYPWIMDNLGEATLARRRAYAALVDHLPPLGQKSVLSDDLDRIHGDIHKFNTLEDGLLRQEFRKRISTTARAARLPGVPAGNEPFDDKAIAAADAWLHRQMDEATPISLHVLGQSPNDREVLDPLVASLRKPFLERVAALVPPPPTLPATESTKWAQQSGRLIIERAVLGTQDAPTGLENDVTKARELLARMRQCDREIAAVLEGLEGGFIRPGPGPDPVRNPASAPGGRNLYGLNPEEIPTQPSYAVAVQLIDELLATKQPAKVGIDLNGMETMRDFGVNEGQVLYLLGVRPKWDHNNLAVDVELIPRAELKHPRIDVFIAMGGMYKENFPSRVRLLDKAVRLAAAAEEADNGVRAGTDSQRAVLLAHGMNVADAEALSVARIFGTKPGNMSGTNILYLIPRSGVWEKEEEVTSIYLDSMSYAYTGERWGEKIDGLYNAAIQRTDTLIRVWASNMTSQLSNHHAYEYLGGLSMAVRTLTGKEPEAFIADVRNPDGARMRRFEEVLESNLRTELLNKQWLAGMKAHDYAGAGHIAELVKNTFGWSVTRPGSVDPRVWDEIHQVLVKDKHNLDLNRWFEQQNPAALQEIAATMLEAARKGHWKPNAAVLREIAELYAQLTITHGATTGVVGGGNQKLDEQVATLAPGLAQAFTAAVAASRTAPAGDRVLGKRLQSQTPPAAQPSPVLQPQSQPAPPPAPVAAATNSTTPTSEPQPTAPTWRWLIGVAMGALVLIGLLRRTGSMR